MTWVIFLGWQIIKATHIHTETTKFLSCLRFYHLGLKFFYQDFISGLSQASCELGRPRQHNNNFNCYLHLKKDGEQWRGRTASPAFGRAQRWTWFSRTRSCWVSSLVWAFNMNTVVNFLCFHWLEIEAPNVHLEPPMGFLGQTWLKFTDHSWSLFFKRTAIFEWCVG